MNAPAKVEKAKKDTGIISIHGKEYQSVALRVSKFRDAHPDWSLTTDIVERDTECVVVQALIGDETGRILATGHAEEYRKSSQINRTSALENAETSAIGRALAALGFGGTEFATANEVQNAIHQQDVGTGETAAPRIQTNEPAAREKLDGPHECKTKLKAAVTKVIRQAQAAESIDVLEAVKAEHKHTINQALRDWPELINGDPNVEEDIGLKGVFERRREELAPKPEDSLSLQMLLSILETCESRNDLSALLEEHGAVAETLDGEESRRWEQAYETRETAIMAAAPLGAG